MGKREFVVYSVQICGKEYYLEPLYIVVLCCMALGLVTGTLAGLLGIGGGLIIVPVLTWLLSTVVEVDAKLAMPIAIATSLFTIIVTSFSSARAHYALGNVVPAIVSWCALGISIGAIAGANIASVLPIKTLSMVFAGFVILIAMHMVFGRRITSKHHYTPFSLVVAGCFTGTISALMGIGGGAILVPVLVWFQVPIRQAIGCAALSGLVVALFGTGSFVISGWQDPQLPEWTLGYVYLPAGIGIMLSSVFTAGFGARLGQNMPTDLLKNILAALLVIISIRMIIGLE